MKYYHKINFVKLIRDNKLFKTVLGTIEREGPVVVKAYLNKLSKITGLAKYKEILEQMQKKLELLKYPNVMPYQGLVQDSRAALLIRQYFPFSLRQRINSMPLLTKIDKLWVSFQLLCGLNQIHGENIVHGDIKTDNVMVTSWNWVFLTDFAPYKPTYVAAQNLGDYYFFFAPESTKITGCYLAPERFVPKIMGSSEDQPLKDRMAMDVFSLGCVLAEIFLDGKSLFGLPQIQAYKKGDYDPSELLNEIEYKDVRELIQDMIQLEPEKRKSANEYLRMWCEKVFPSSFIQFLYYFSAGLLHPSMASPDRKIGFVLTHLEAIWQTCFQKPAPLIIQSLNGSVCEAVRDIPFGRIIADVTPKGFPFCVKYNGLDKEIDLELIRKTTNKELAEDNAQSIMVVVSLLGAALSFCRCPSSKVCALSILKHIGVEVKSPFLILQHLIPYFISNLQDESSLVQTEAAEGGMELLEVIALPMVLSPTDFKIFQSYIFPEYRRLGTSSSNYIRSTFMKLLGKICTYGKRFIEQGITNQTNYFNSAASKEEDLRMRRLTSVVDQLGPDRTICNLDTELDELAASLQSVILDIIYSVEPIYQCALASHLHEITMLMGPKRFEGIQTMIFSMLNNKIPQLSQTLFEIIPSISMGIGLEWVRNLLSILDMYMNHTEELVVYSLIECFVELGKKQLLTKDQMVGQLPRFCPFLLHPNEWIRSSAINFGKIVCSSLTDAEVFTRIRQHFQGYVKNFILMSSADPFYEFLQPPLTRTVIDMIEAGVIEELHQIPTDEMARAMLEREKPLKEIIAPDASERDKENYDKHQRTIERFCASVRPDCIGRLAVVSAAVPVNSEGQPLSPDWRKTAIPLSDTFQVSEEDADDYIDQHYCPHVIPDKTTWSVTNNGQNLPDEYEGYIREQEHKESWRATYKKLWLCKALRFCPQPGGELDQLKDKQGKFFSYSVQHQWKAWKPQGRLMATLNAHKAPVYSISVSDDTSFMATGSSDGLCCIWNTLKLKESLAVPMLDKIEVRGKITALRFLENTHSVAIGTDQGKIYVYKIDSQSQVQPVQKTKEIATTDEGGIVDCCTYLTGEGQNVLVYTTQLGGIHVHDMRVKKDVNYFNMGCQRGVVNCMCMGRDENDFLIGTLGGYIAGYDLRFNLITLLRKYTRGTPICDLCTYLPERVNRMSAGSPTKASSDGPTPLLFIASGCETPQVDLCCLDKDQTEWSFVVGNPKMAYKSFTPYGLVREELNYTDVNHVVLKKLMKGFAVSGEELAGGQTSTNWHFTFKDFYGKLKSMYNSSSRVYKILCPRTARTEESAPFLLTASADRVVRYWSLNGPEMAKQSFVVISPDDREVEYTAADFREKVMYEHTLRAKTGTAAGQAPWQCHNGTAYLRQHVNRVPCAGHTDAILNLALLELPTGGTYMATCGRDNLVKLWSQWTFHHSHM